MTERTETTATEKTDEHMPQIEQELDVYPLRDASEDPTWAVWVMWIWIGMAVSLFLFFIVLFILGIYFD